MKTTDKIQQVKELLLTKFGEEVRMSDVLQHLKLRGIHEMNFYYLYYSGCLEKKHRGLYFKTLKFKTMSALDIYNNAQTILNRMRERKVANKPLPKKHTGLEAEYIKYLKDKGYKILKPATEYIEI